MIFLLFLLQTITAFTGKVVHIADGDTFTVLDSNKNQIKVRFHGIDCPEKGQDFGHKAKEFTSDFCKHKQVKVIPTDTDRYGRTVAIVIADFDTLNIELLKAGLAWHYKHYDKNPIWDAYERQARKNKKGIWSIPNPTPPWEWRKTRK